MCESSLEQSNYVFICFVDYENAFDRVDLVNLLGILKEIDVDWRDRRLIVNLISLYMQQMAVFKVFAGTFGRQRFGKRSHYAEEMTINAMEGEGEGINIGCKFLQDVRFTDDQGMIADTSGLQKIMERFSAKQKNTY